MLTIRNQEILEAAPALRELSEHPLPAVTALKVVRLARVVESAAKDILDARNRAIERYTERDDHGQPIPVKGEDGSVVEGHVRLNKPDAFAREIDALLGGETHLEASPIQGSELVDFGTIAPKLLLHLGRLLTLDELT